MVSPVEDLNILQIARLYYRLCSFDQAVPLLLKGLEQARAQGKWSEYGEITALLVRIWAERMEFKSIDNLIVELDSLDLPTKPSRLSYALGVMAAYRGQAEQSAKHFDSALTTATTVIDRGYAIFGQTYGLVQHQKYAEAIELLQSLQTDEFQTQPDLQVAAHLLFAVVYRKQGRFEEALASLHQSQQYCQRESNVYMALNTMFGLASTYIEMKEFGKAREHLNLLTQLVNPNDLTHLAKQVQAKKEEIEKIQTEAPEIRLVEGTERLLYTPAGEKVDLKKQFVLVNLLKLLGEKREDSLSKEEMVNRLWKEDYHPLRHDNKVHATILRLRKLIEPDLKSPQFILNAQDGYRLNPKIHFTVQGGEL